MPYPNEHAARIRDPDDFVRIRQIGGSEEEGIRILGGPLKSDPEGSTETQAVRFKKDQWSPEEAKEWLREHDYEWIEFEPATGEAESVADYEYECAGCGFLEASWDEESCRWCGDEVRVQGKVINIEAADGGTRVEGTAYTGGKLKLPQWKYPVVVDLEGLQIPDTVPLLTNHENRTGNRVGVVRARVQGGRLLIEGSILSSSGQARGIVEQGKAGADWQLSIGAEVKDAELIRKGTKTVNGQQHEAPFYHVKASVLREVSILPVGADSDTRMKVAAKFTLDEGGSEMDFEKWLEAKGFSPEDLDEDQEEFLRARYEAEQEEGEDKGDEDPEETPETVQGGAGDEPESDPAEEVRQATRQAATEEQKRISAVQDLCAEYEGAVEAEDLSEIRAEAIEAGWDEKDTELALLRAGRSSRPDTTRDSDEDGTTRGDVLEAALSLGTGLPEDDVVESCGEQALEAAQDRFGGPIGAGQFVLECAWANGFSGRSIHPGNLRPALTAAFSSRDVSDILSNVANKVLQDAFDNVESTWKSIASTRPVNDFKQVTHYRLNGDFEYQEVGPDGELKHGSASDESYTNQAQTFGRIFVLSRQDIINDDLGAFDQLRTMLGRGAALKFNKVFWTEFMDNAGFFNDANDNYMSGADTDLDVASLSDADQLFLEQTDANGDPLGIEPEYLLVPPALKQTAKQLLESTRLKGDTDEPENNPHAGNYEAAVSSYLSNGNISGNSNVAWYLLADPADMAVIQAVFLNGRQRPTVESADADFNTLGVQIRGYHDFGVSKAEPEGGVKSLGEAE